MMHSSLQLTGMKTFQGSNFCLQELLNPREGLEVKETRGRKKSTREGFGFVMLNKKKVYVTCSISRNQWGGCGLTSEHKDTSCLICKRKKHVVSPEEEHVWAPKHEPLCVCVCARAHVNVESRHSAGMHVLFLTTLSVSSLDTPYEFNVFSFLLMTFRSAVSHERHQNYL